MLRFQVGGHSLLSDDACRLDPAELSAEAKTAEVVLMLDDAELTPGSPRYETAVLAIVRQINYQVALGPDAWALVSETEGSQSRTYRDGGDRGLPPAHPIAWKLARRAHPIRTRFVP